MNSLIRFVEKYHFLLLFLVLEIFSLWLLSRHTYYQRSKFENITRAFSGYTSSKVDAAHQYLSLSNANKVLAEENLELRNQLARLTARYEIISTQIGDTIVDSQYVFIPAKTINNSINKQYNYITLNVGSKHGIEREMGVVSSNGIVGIVAGVSENYSTVISLLNVDLKISAKLKKSHHFGSLYWDGANYRKVILSDIPQHVQISVGDTIITSGFSSIFPADIKLGVIESFDSRGSNFHTIKVHLFKDFKQLNNVWVVRNNHENERQILEETLTNQ
jgi:rod shape-determining protein MreC